MTGDGPQTTDLQILSQLLTTYMYNTTMPH